MPLTLGPLCWALAAVLAQTASPAGTRTWTVATGHDAIVLADVSRSTRPVETSPVRLEGSGLTLRVAYEAENDRRAHLVSAAATPAFASFARIAPSEEIAEPGDGGSDVRARYEYRRYPLRAVVRGVDLGVGAIVHAGRRSLSRALPPANGFATAGLEGGGGLSAAVRVRTWPRVRIDADVAGLLLIERSRETHDAARDEALTQSGGGWRLEARTSARVRLSRALWLTAGYEGTGQLRLGARRGSSERRTRLDVGVAYVR